MHFSLDLWNTLFIPNPEFARKRNAFIAGKLGIGSEHVEKVYTRTKRRLDSDAERYGIGNSCFSNYKELLVELSDETETDFWEVEKILSGLYEEVQKLFLQYPPEIPYSTIVTMKNLAAKGHTFSISSNTNFVSGNTIQDVLYKIFGSDVYNLFSFFLFSDLLRVSKPDPAFWKTLNFYKECCSFSVNAELVHIGDNPICDNPSPFADIKYRIIENPFQLSDTLKELVSNNE